MPSVHQVQLASKVVHEHFGSLTELVVATLLKKGRQSLPELFGACNASLSAASRRHVSQQQQQQTVSRQQLKQALLVLIQQNCVRTYLQPAEVRVTGVRPAVHLYEADLMHILQVIRRPKFLQHIRDDTPSNGAAAAADVSSVIIEVLLEHGRLRFDQIRSAVVSRLTQDDAAAAAATSQQDGDDSMQQDGQQQQKQQLQLAGSKAAEVGEAVRWSFVQLLQEHYIERAPPCNLPPPQPISVAAKKVKKTAPKPGSIEYAEAQSRAMQQLAHRTYEEARFKAPKELVAGMGTEDDDVVDAAAAAAAAAAEEEAAAPSAAAKPSKKRKKVAGGVSEEGAVAAAAVAAAEAAAANATVARQAAALANKRRKTGSKASKAEAVAAGDGNEQQQKQDEVVVKQEDGIATNTTAVASPAKFARGRAAAAAAQQQQEEVSPPSAREMLWRVNPEEFNRRFRNKVMADLVADKLGADAGLVLAAMLSHGRRFETAVKGDVSIAMGEGEVASALKAGQDAGRLPQLSPGKDVGALLNALAYDSLGAVDSGTGPQGATFTVNMHAVLDRCRLLQLHAVLSDKFGIHGLRVFQTLLMRGQLEQKQVADTVMQPHKETRELLYRMLRAGYVQMQDIPRTNDRAPTRCFYTWHIDIDAVFSKLAADLYHAAVNLHTRRSHEMQKHSELVELVESARAAGQLNFNMTDGQRRALERLNKVSTALDTSLLRLDGMIALFNEY
ncbi:hypothetical protein COO60DRAFT_870422 [Scenedesmus sp. NREL 46B-D3]|nr:hypothetical protein COO60DRAFT_870422 [Scenedesmus sp. NREL 46B-D3]